MLKLNIERQDAHGSIAIEIDDENTVISILEVTGGASTSVVRAERIRQALKWAKDIEAQVKAELHSGVDQAHGKDRTVVTYVDADTMEVIGDFPLSWAKDFEGLFKPTHSVSEAIKKAVESLGDIENAPKPEKPYLRADAHKLMEFQDLMKEIVELLNTAPGANNPFSASGKVYKWVKARDRVLEQLEARGWYEAKDSKKAV